MKQVENHSINLKAVSGLSVVPDFYDLFFPTYLNYFILYLNQPLIMVIKLFLYYWKTNAGSALKNLIMCSIINETEF
jgi:hypothetical protein